MKCPTFFLNLAGSLLIMISTAATSRAQQPANPFSEGTFETEVTLKVGYGYLLSLPDGYEADPNKKWPLLVFLHGAGERGSNLELLKKHGPPKLIAQGTRKFEAVVVCPQVPAGSTWNPIGVKALVDKIKAENRIDESRIYLTGISMGGFGTWETIANYPDTFAAAVAICGGAGINILKFGALKKLPIWLFHGEADPVVPVAYSQSAYARLKKEGGNIQFTPYPGVSHDSWTRTYEDENMWTWLFSQKKP